MVAILRIVIDVVIARIPANVLVIKPPITDQLPQPE